MVLCLSSSDLLYAFVEMILREVIAVVESKKDYLSITLSSLESLTAGRKKDHSIPTPIFYYSCLESQRVGGFFVTNGRRVRRIT